MLIFFPNEYPYRNYNYNSDYFPEVFFCFVHAVCPPVLLDAAPTGLRSVRLRFSTQMPSLRDYCETVKVVAFKDGSVLDVHLYSDIRM